jgi:hypothetical protein
MFRTRDVVEDYPCGLCPDEGLGVCVVVFEVVHDGSVQLGNAFEDAAADEFSGDLGEEALDHVEPGGGGRGEVQVEARVRREPAFDGRGLVGGVVVDDQAGRDGAASVGRSP